MTNRFWLCIELIIYFLFVTTIRFGLARGSPGCGVAVVGVSCVAPAAFALLAL